MLYAGNQGSYGILQTVTIICTATDPSPGSGIASTSCANIQGPAYGFGAGAHTFSAVAADAAGNQGHATTSFTVTPTAADLCTLTKQFAESSAKFQALGPKQQAAVDAIVTGACNAIAKIVVNLGPKQKAVLVALYEAGVASLAQAGWLTSAQAANARPARRRPLVGKPPAERQALLRVRRSWSIWTTTNSAGAATAIPTWVISRPLSMSCWVIVSGPQRT